MSTNDVVNIFIAYSRLDLDYLIELKKYVIPLERKSSVNFWYDGEIRPGSVWEQEIKKHLHQADIVVLLVSANSIASEYFYEKEVAEALERHNKKKTTVIPIILKSCTWEMTPLGELQALPQNGKPIDKWEKESDAYTDIANNLNKTINTKFYEKQEIKRQVKKEQQLNEEFDTKSKVKDQQSLIVDQGSIKDTETTIEAQEQESLKEVAKAKRKPKEEKIFVKYKVLLILITSLAILAIIIWNIDHGETKSKSEAQEQESLIVDQGSTKDTETTIEAQEQESMIVEQGSTKDTETTIEAQEQESMIVEQGSIKDTEATIEAPVGPRKGEFEDEHIQTILVKVSQAHGYDRWEYVRKLKIIRIDSSTTNAPFSKIWVWSPIPNTVTAIYDGDTLFVDRNINDRSYMMMLEGKKYDKYQTWDNEFITYKYSLLFPFYLRWDWGEFASKYSANSRAPISNTEMQKLTIIYGMRDDELSELVIDIYFEDDYLIKESMAYKADNVNEILALRSWENYSNKGGLRLSKTKRVPHNIIYDKTWFITSYEVNGYGSGGGPKLMPK